MFGKLSTGLRKYNVTTDKSDKRIFLNLNFSMPLYLSPCDDTNSYFFPPLQASICFSPSKC